MNIVLTNKCNRRCTYCFQKDWFLESPDRPVTEMPLELFKRIVTHFRLESVQILGGEPFLYSQMGELMDFCEKRNVEVAPLSNLSVESSVMKEFIDRYAHIMPRWLINSDYTEAQEEVFLRNIETLSVHSEYVALSVGTTFYPEKGSEVKKIERIKKILDILKGKRLPYVRIATMTPAHTDSYDEYDYTEMVRNFVTEILKVYPKVRISFDCPTQSCEVSIDMIREFPDNLVPQVNLCIRPVLDIMPDGSCIWCSSARFISLSNALKCRTLRDLNFAMASQWRKVWRVLGFPAECRECQSLNPGICNGKCLAKVAIQSGKVMEFLKEKNTNENIDDK